MATELILSTDVLKDAAKEHKLEQDHKRELDNKHKWALGDVVDNPLNPDTLVSRPLKPRGKGFTAMTRREADFRAKKAAKNAKISLANASQEASDTSAEEDVKDASAAPAPDAEIAYSFDARRGPSHGSEILSLAIANAVEKFEGKATERLIKNEYEIVGKENDTTGEGYVADEDDFEMI